MGRRLTGKRIRAAALAVIAAYIICAVWLVLPLPGEKEASAAAGILLPFSLAAMVPYLYLTMVPGIVQIRWALKNPQGTPEEYREHRSKADEEAMGRAGNGLVRWIVSLRTGTW